MRTNTPGQSNKISSPAAGSGQDKALRLFQYLSKLAEIRTKPVINVDSYDNLLWFADAPSALNTECVDVNTGGSGPWISVQRPTLPQSPNLPKVCVGWAVPGTLEDWNSAPRIAPSIEEVSADTDPDLGLVRPLVTVPIEDRPEVEQAWNEYLVEWSAWSAQMEEVSPVFNFYQSLYHLRDRATNLGEQYETVVGVGLLSMKGVKGTVRRHLLTIPVEISLDVTTGALSVAPTGNAYLTFEEDMLEANEMPDRASQAKLAESLKELGSEPFGHPELNGSLQAWINLKYSDGIFLPQVSQNTHTSSAPIITLAPALILRKRTPKSLLRMYNSIAETIKLDGVAPDSILDLVDTRDTATLCLTPDAPIYFPLPANERQREIIERLRTNRGVVVQGPPGTGKSHTIANLIAHLLAEGQRVLVTSQTERALEVLKDKLPGNFSNLCVSLLSKGKDGSRDLEASISALDRELAKPNWAETYKTKITSLEERLRKAKEDEHSLRDRPQAARLSQVDKCTLPGYEGTASQIAQKLSAESSKFKWLDTPTKTIEAPLANVEALELLSLLRSATSDLRSKADHHIPNEMVSPETIAGTLKEIFEVKTSPSSDNWHKHLEHLTNSERTTLKNTLKALEQSIKKVERSTHTWSASFLNPTLEGRCTLVESLWQETKQTLKHIDNPALLDSYFVTGIEESKLKALETQASTLAKHLSEGGKMKTFFGRPTPVKEAQLLLDTVTVGGLPPNTFQACQLSLEAISAKTRILLLKQVWGGIFAPEGSFVAQISAISDTYPQLEAILEVGKHLQAVEAVIAKLSDLETPIWTDTSSRIAFCDAVDETESLIKIKATKALLETWKKPWREASLAFSPAPECMAALEALNAKDATAYSAAYNAIMEIRKVKQKVLRSENLLSKLSETAPELANLLSKEPHSEFWNDALTDFDRAWAWSRAEQWHRDLLDEQNSNLISRQLGACEENILLLTKELGEAKAWLAALSRLSIQELQHLRAYQRAIRDLGKGEGKGAFRERRNAQEHMEKAQSAVPAWIMPIHRVAESIAPDRHVFDVVIVDEASQSGVEALFLMWLAKKIIVVGDDKQVSPEAVGMNQDSIDTFQDQLLHDLSLKDALGPKSSLFDQAKLRYQGRITLEEHFRCMPEIISFSDKLMYDGRLQPLKQFGVDRLDPLKRKFVPGAKEESAGAKKSNSAEADAIVAAIEQCIADPAYEGKTMGVISLLGLLQADLIQGRLLQRIGAEEMERRRIRCSDAPGFQGDERQIIFLSMVISPNQNGNKVRMLGDAQTLRRFNVAASRAEEQMWLFHSVQISDLNPDCPRAKLLNHFLVPSSSELKELRGKVTRDEPHPTFDSLFEQRVYLDIIRKGYRVVPQWEVLGRRIDLVVVGKSARLAVECDGDYWHGPEQYEADMARERDLQRVGWQFFRIRGSEYYHSADNALAALWPLLEERGIFPVGLEPTPPVNKTAEKTINTETLNPSLKSSEMEKEQNFKLEDSALLAHKVEDSKIINISSMKSKSLEPQPEEINSSAPNPSGRTPKNIKGMAPQAEEPNPEPEVIQKPNPPKILFSAPRRGNSQIEIPMLVVQSSQPIEPETPPSIPQRITSPTLKRNPVTTSHTSKENKAPKASEFTIAMEDYLSRLLTPEKKEYAEAYARFIITGTNEPALPDSEWVNKVQQKVRRFQRTPQLRS